MHNDALHPHVDGAKRYGGRLRLARELSAFFRRAGLADIADRLSNCSHYNRCGDGACPQCAIAPTRVLMERVDQLQRNASSLQFATIIPSDIELLHGTLDEFEIGAHRRALHDGLFSVVLGGLPLVGGLDFSLNHYRGDIHLDAWVAHWHCITADCDPADLKATLSQAFRNSPLVRVAVKVKPITRTPDRVASYCFKTVFEEKTIRIEGKRQSTRTDGYIKKSNPRFLELMKMLSRTYPMDRVIVRNVCG